MPLPPKPTYTCKGKNGEDLTFTLIPTTPNNRDRVAEFLRVYREQTVEIASAMRQNALREELLTKKELGQVVGEIPEEAEVPEWDQYEYHHKLFCALTEGPHDQIDFGNFDIQLGAAAQMDFLPASAQMMSIALESLV